jgi:hypothetical protein
MKDSARDATRRCTLHVGHQYAPQLAETLRAMLKKSWPTKRAYAGGGTFPVIVEIRVDSAEKASRKPARPEPIGRKARR